RKAFQKRITHTIFSKIIFSMNINKHHFKIFSCVLFSLSMLIPFHVFSPYSLIALTTICTQMHLKK
ncbi:TPA: hypothetical protein ACYSAO_003536, partial [Proteus mirabilis]